MRAPGPWQLFGLFRCRAAATQALSRPRRPRGDRSAAAHFASGITCSRGDSEDTRGGSAGDDQIGPTGREPPSAGACPCVGRGHLPRKGGEGELCISLLQGELPKAEGVPIPIDNALNHPYGCSLPHVNRPQSVLLVAHIGTGRLEDRVGKEVQRDQYQGESGYRRYYVPPGADDQELSRTVQDQSDRRRRG